MGISASRTFVLSKGEVAKPIVESPNLTQKSSGLKAEKIIVLSKITEQKDDVIKTKRNSLSEWRAEKPGKKSLFLEDMLTNYE